MSYKLGVLTNYKNVGKLHGEGDSFASGSVKHYNFKDLDELYNIIEAVGKNPLLCNVIGHFPRNGKVVPTVKAQVGEMTRTKTVVGLGNILVIDNDFGSDFDRNIIGKHWEAFHSVNHIVTKSGSTLAGKKEHGSHTYYIVSEGTRTLKLALQLLEAIYIIEGVYKVEYQATGKAVIKTPIDISLSQSSRVVYEDDTKPVKVTYIDGHDTVDLTELPKNFKKIMDKAQTIKEKKLSGKVGDKSLKLHAKYVKQTRGLKLKTKEERKASIEDYDKGEVDETFKLYKDGKELGTVGDLVLGRIDEVYFQDLYEPEYGGGGQKAIYYPDTQTFFSQAHGGITYKIFLSDSFNTQLMDEFVKEVPFLKDGANIEKQLMDMLECANVIDKKRLVRDYAKENGVTAVDVEKELTRLKGLHETFEYLYNLWLRGEYQATVNPEKRLANFIEYKTNSTMVNTGGKIVIVTKYKDDNNNIVTGMNPLDTEIKMWSDRQSTLLNINKKTGEADFKEVDTPTLFVEGDMDESGEIVPAERKKGMEFAPKKELKVAYNLFNGFAVEPKKGNIKNWKKHMTKAFGKTHYEFIMDWFADMYQNPDRKCLYAVVVKGEKGTGKNTFEEALGRNLLSSDNYFRTANQEQLFGKFNKQLASNLLIVGQELTWGGDHRYDSALKDMITESTRVLEIKGLDAFIINNLSRMYFTSNSDWVVPATFGERRFYVASTFDDAHTKAQWAEFYVWLRSEGVREALMYEMMNRDLSNFNHVKCPETIELGQQKAETLYGVDRFVSNAIENEFFGTYREFNTIDYVEGKRITVNTLYVEYALKNDIRKLTLMKFSRRLTELGFVERAKIDNKNAIILPTFEEIKKTFRKATGVYLL